MKKVLDKEWVYLIMLAKELNVSMDEIKSFIKEKQQQQEKRRKLPV